MRNFGLMLLATSIALTGCSKTAPSEDPVDTTLPANTPTVTENAAAESADLNAAANDAMQDVNAAAAAYPAPDPSAPYIVPADPSTATDDGSQQPNTNM
jgi:hypothetical protein